MKRISVTAMMVLLAIWCAYASVSIGTYEMYLRSEILNGEGTLDVIDEIPGPLSMESVYMSVIMKVLIRHR